MTDAPKATAQNHCDVLIIGAGPAGLSLALSLRGIGLDVRLVERQHADDLAEPAYDGREIALSLRSIDILKRIGAWHQIAADEIAPLRAAKVIDGRWRAALQLNADAVGEDALGCFVANSVLRRALYAEQATQGEATLLTEAEMVGLDAGPDGGTVDLADGRRIEAGLIVAADTRFSAARRMAGIAAAMHDFGKTMIVARVALERPHHQVAWECFLPGGALAILPLNDREVSVVQTFPPDEAERQMALDIGDYVDAANRRLKRHFGRLTPLSERFAYPLVGVYANAFTRPGFALVGDAAVGMHPITAHGFNLGVQGQSILAGHIRRARKRGLGVADPGALAVYDRAHRRLSAGMYWSTLAIAELYARDSLTAKVARRALLDAGRLLPPARRMIMRNLTQPLAGRRRQRLQPRPNVFGGGAEVA